MLSGLLRNSREEREGVYSRLELRLMNPDFFLFVKIPGLIGNFHWYKILPGRWLIDEFVVTERMR